MCGSSCSTARGARGESVIPGIEIRPLYGDDSAALVDLFETVLPGFAASATNDGPKRFVDDPTMFALGA